MPDMNSVGKVAGRRRQTWSLPGPVLQSPPTASTHALGVAWYGACGESRCDAVPKTDAVAPKPSWRIRAARVEALSAPGTGNEFTPPLAGSATSWIRCPGPSDRAAPEVPINASGSSEAEDTTGSRSGARPPCPAWRPSPSSERAGTLAEDAPGRTR